MQNNFDQRGSSQNAEDQIMKAISSFDFDGMESMIERTVNSALTEAYRGLKRGEYQIKKSIRASQNAAASRSGTTRKKTRQLVAKHPKGTVSGPVMMVGGFASLCGAFAALGTGLVFGMGTIAVSVVTLSLLAIGGIFGGKAASLMNRVKRFREYNKVMGARTFCETNELADSVGKSQKFVKKDLKRMIGDKMYLEGHLSDDGDYFILSKEAYEAYQKMIIGEEIKQKEKEAREKLEEENPYYKEAHTVIEEGQKTLKKIREANDAIPGEEISDKLSRLELVIRRIFDFLEEHPSKVRSMRHFISYYLPTTEKLVEAYKELDAQPVQGTNIVRAKSEIEGSLDTIIDAFEQLLDNFYRETVIDVSSDISVMKTMFAQDGLTPDEIHANRQKQEES